MNCARKSKLEALDVDFMKAQETGADTSSIVAKKKELRDYPANIQVGSPLGPFTVSSSTDKVDTRARARLAAVKIENDGRDESWRFGQFRFDIQPDGRR